MKKDPLLKANQAKVVKVCCNYSGQRGKFKHYCCMRDADCHYFDKEITDCVWFEKIKDLIK